MNDATEQIVRWHLSGMDGAEDHLDPLISSLHEGIGIGDFDAYRILDAILASAHEAARGSDDEMLLARLFDLHYELEAIGLAKRKIEALSRQAATAETE